MDPKRISASVKLACPMPAITTDTKPAPFPFFLHELGNSIYSHKYIRGPNRASSGLLTVQLLKCADTWHRCCKNLYEYKSAHSWLRLLAFFVGEIGHKVISVRLGFASPSRNLIGSYKGTRDITFACLFLNLGGEDVCVFWMIKARTKPATSLLDFGFQFLVCFEDACARRFIPALTANQ